VQGVAWRLRLADLAALNAYEAVGSGLYRRRRMPVLVGGRRRSALVYVGRNVTPGRPRPGYLPIVLDAARSLGLSSAYVGGLRRWSPSGWRGALPPDTGAVG
jgi:hypothetical protein